MLGKKIKIVTYDNFPFGGASANLLRYLSLALANAGNIVEVVLPTGNYYGKNVEANPKRNGNVEHVTYKHLGLRHHPLNYLGKIIGLAHLINGKRILGGSRVGSNGSGYL